MAYGSPLKIEGKQIILTKLYNQYYNIVKLNLSEVYVKNRDKDEIDIIKEESSMYQIVRGVLRKR